MAGAAKYHEGNLIPMFRLAAKLRRQMLKAGFTDNGGAIHSAERILNILGQRLVYPGLSHINNLKKYPKAIFSKEAQIAHKRGEKIFIEHVAPHREFTRAAIAKIEQGTTDEEFKKYVKKNFRLVLLTKAETDNLNSINRSKMVRNRLAGINFISN